jgi:hypothetical protein
MGWICSQGPVVSAAEPLAVAARLPTLVPKTLSFEKQPLLREALLQSQYHHRQILRPLFFLALCKVDMVTSFI